jgi:hypothetical protein
MGIYQTIHSPVLSGIYATVIFIIMLRVVPVKKNLEEIGVFNKWAVLIAVIFTFGFLKHEIGYYFTIETNYCKATGICNDLVKNTKITSLDKVKTTLGFLQNIWLESFGEGVVFVLVGLPSFIFISNKYVAAFITGVLGHLFSEYSGFHTYFCRTSCNINPLGK